MRNVHKKIVWWHLVLHQQPSAQTRDTETSQGQGLEHSKKMLFLEKTLKGWEQVKNDKRPNLENVNLYNLKLFHKSKWFIKKLVFHEKLVIIIFKYLTVYPSTLTKNLHRYNKCKYLKNTFGRSLINTNCRSRRSEGYECKKTLPLFQKNNFVHHSLHFT